MSFSKFWSMLQDNLMSGERIKNWTVAKGYLGDEFRVLSVYDAGVDVDTPHADNIQHVAKKEFEVMYNNWDAYYSGKLQRQELRDLTRFSKYTMSILKHLKHSQS